MAKIKIDGVEITIHEGRFPATMEDTEVWWMPLPPKPNKERR